MPDSDNPLAQKASKTPHCQFCALDEDFIHAPGCPSLLREENSRNAAASLWWSGFYLGFSGTAGNPSQVPNETYRLGVGCGLSARQQLADDEQTND